jgi:transposase
MKAISVTTRNDILSLIDQGLSSRAISKRVSVSHMTVSRIRHEAAKSDKQANRGRPAKLSLQDKRKLAWLITSGEVGTAVKATKVLLASTNVKASSQTVRRALRDAGLKARAKQKKPRLLPHHFRQRFEFAKRHESWTVEDWKRVIWSDETKISRLSSEGREWTWKRPGEGLQAPQVKGTLKFGGGSLMLWGCMTAQGVGYACRIEGRMDAHLYTRILDDEFQKTIEYYGLDRSRLIFQQDNDPKHTSRLASKWFGDNGIKVLKWPAQSPDLNPIEHLWQYLKRQLAKYETEPAGMLELWERVEAEWNAIPAQVCLELIESMPRRIMAVLMAKGGYTKY